MLFQGAHAGKRDVLVRVHDQCLTSEVLGSRRCDCKEQLELAMDRVAAGEEGGLIIYLPQVGGVGLVSACMVMWDVAVGIGSTAGWSWIDACLNEDVGRGWGMP